MPPIRLLKSMAIEDLRQSAMMSHLMDSLANHQDIGHYGRLVFVTVSQWFLSQDEIVQQLTQDPDCTEAKARILVKQIEAKGYNPPKRERVIEWMNQQDFPICDTTDDGEGCNVYKSLNFPPEVYNKIASYYEHEQ